MTAVIVPVYNQEPYLRRTLDSLLAQTCGEWVAVCVNDGSTDLSPSIIRAYAAKDARFVSVDKLNGGLSSARNTGLDFLRDRRDVDFVHFLDGDDFYHPRCIELSRGYAQANPGAVVEWGYRSEDEKGFRELLPDASAPVRRAKDFSPCVWNKTYPLSVIGDTRFDSATDGAEDIVFCHALKHRVKPVVLATDVPLVFYSQNADSAVHRPLTRAALSRLLAAVERMIAISSGDASELRTLCRDAVPDLLKVFYRRIGRQESARRMELLSDFRRELRALRKRGLLLPKRGSLKDLKYYLRFQLMSRSGI